LGEIKGEMKGISRVVIEQERERGERGTYLFMEPSSIGGEAEVAIAMA
jgi:hypothetical protein